MPVFCRIVYWYSNHVTGTGGKSYYNFIVTTCPTETWYRSCSRHIECHRGFPLICRCSDGYCSVCVFTRYGTISFKTLLRNKIPLSSIVCNRHIAKVSASTIIQILICNGFTFLLYAICVSYTPWDDTYITGWFYTIYVLGHVPRFATKVFSNLDFIRPWYSTVFKSKQHSRICIGRTS